MTGPTLRWVVRHPYQGYYVRDTLIRLALRLPSGQVYTPDRAEAEREAARLNAKERKQGGRL